MRLAYCVLGDRGASEDAVQDAFVSLNRHHHSLLAVAPALVPKEAAVSQDDAARLAAAVRGLPRRQCEVVVCRYYLQLTAAETAELLGMGVGSVKRHAHRALQFLSTRLEVSA